MRIPEEHIEDTDRIDYLGDSLHIYNEGHCVWLLANDPRNQSDSVCLDVSVFEALNRVAARWGFARRKE